MTLEPTRSEIKFKKIEFATEMLKEGKGITKTRDMLIDTFGDALTPNELVAINNKVSKNKINRNDMKQTIEFFKRAIEIPEVLVLLNEFQEFPNIIEKMERLTKNAD